MQSNRTTSGSGRIQTWQLIPIALLLICQTAWTQAIAYRQLPVGTYNDKAAGQTLVDLTGGENAARRNPFPVELPAYGYRFYRLPLD